MIIRFLLLNFLLLSSAWPQAQPPAKKPEATVSAPSAEETARAAKFFAAQERLRANDTKIKRAAETARAAHETARTKTAAGATLRRQGQSKNLDERKDRAAAREAEIDAEVQAETAQVALEEAELDEILKEDASLADLIAERRTEIAARKKMLVIRANNAGRIELDPEEAASRPIPPEATAGDKGTK